MTTLPFDATVDDYTRESEKLFAAVEAGDDASAWRLKWEHPRFREMAAHDIRRSDITMADAKLVVAHEHAFDTWADLIGFVQSVKHDRTVSRFETAADAVVSGDLEMLRSMLRHDPELVYRRSARRHHATLLHYVAANGVEGGRQKTPENAVEIARLLLDAGAEPDAFADMYAARSTTMALLVSSAHPAAAGLQPALAELLLDYGASIDRTGKHDQSPVVTALAFGYLETAEALARRGATLDLPALAGLGRADDVARALPLADPLSRQIALALAAQHGQTAVVKILLDAGEDPNRYNPEGYHSHSTPLHQAAWAGNMDVVRLLVEHGARLDLEDTIYLGTPFDWAIHGNRDAVANYLRQQPGERQT